MPPDIQANGHGDTPEQANGEIVAGYRKVRRLYAPSSNHGSLRRQALCAPNRERARIGHNETLERTTCRRIIPYRNAVALGATVSRKKRLENLRG